MRIAKHLWFPILLVGYILLALSATVGKHGLLQLWQLRQEQRDLETKAFDLSREIDALRERIARFQNDDAFLEKVVREELKFVKKGELVYLFRGASDTAEQ